MYYRKKSKVEYVAVGNDHTKLDEHIRRLRTELAYCIKRAQVELSSNRAIDVQRFEEHSHKVMTAVRPAEARLRCCTNTS